MKNEQKTYTEELEIGGLTIDFQRTIRIPDDGEVYPLPPGLGSFPIFKVDDYKETVPEEWLEKGGVFIPMYQREAMWLSFDGPNCAVMIDTGKINAVSGKEQTDALSAENQNYVVCPNQPWLDGFNSGDGYIQRFVAMPLGSGYSAEEQLSKEAAEGGMRIVYFPPKPGVITDDFHSGFIVMESDAVQSMALAAGGKMEQDIYPDEYGLDTWNTEKRQELYVHYANSQMFNQITGENPPSTPVSAETYTKYGYPWFKLYDETKGDIAPSDKLSNVKSLSEKDKEKGIEGETSVVVPDDQVMGLKK